MFAIIFVITLIPFSVHTSEGLLILGSNAKGLPAPTDPLFLSRPAGPFKSMKETCEHAHGGCLSAYSLSTQCATTVSPRPAACQQCDDERDECFKLAPSHLEIHVILDSQYKKDLNGFYKRIALRLGKFLDDANLKHGPGIVSMTYEESQEKSKMTLSFLILYCDNQALQSIIPKDIYEYPVSYNCRDSY